MSLIDLIAVSADEVAALVRDWGWPRYRARQTLRWLYQARITDIGAMTDLSHSDRTRLAAEARIGWLTPSEVLTSEDGDRKSTRLNSSHVAISYAVFCLKKKTI